MPMKPKIAITDTVLMLTCLLVCGTTAEHWYRSKYPAAPPPPFKRGEQIVDTPDLGLKGSLQTVLLVTSSKCHFCRESMPFYRRLTEFAHGRRARVVGVTAEPPQVNIRYLTSQGVRADGVAAIQQTKIRVSGTPTLVVVRRDGTVVNSWRGRLTEDQEREVLAAVASVDSR